jgi:hypothetical protein
MDGGDEFDAFTGWKEFLNWDSGERKNLKRKYNKRQRKIMKEELREEVLSLD